MTHHAESRRSGLFRSAGLALAVAVASAAWPVPSLAGTPAGDREPAARPDPPRWPLARLVKREWGIEVAWVRPVALGHMLEFRYRVVDPEKAKELFVRRLKPVLIDEATGVRLKVPNFATTGEMRNSNLPKKGRIYWMVFANPAGVVKSGSRVTVRIGDFDAPGLVVR